MTVKMSRYLVHLLVAAVHLVRAADLSNCYLPDGTQLPFSRAYEPCVKTTGVVSMCCVLNSTALTAGGGSLSQIDTCLPNGLCQTYLQDVYARDACTDPTWKSPNCLTACSGGNVSARQQASFPAGRLIT